MAPIVMTLNVLEGHILMQAFISMILRMCGTSHGPSTSAVLVIETTLKTSFVGKTCWSKFNKFICTILVL